LISYETKYSTTTFIQLVRIEKFKNKIKTNIMKKTHKKGRKKKNLTLM
jgi:hypothetical protein